MPFLQSIRQLVSDGRIKWFQSCLHQGKPGMDPGMDWDCVSQRIPVFNLKAKPRRDLIFYWHKVFPDANNPLTPKYIDKGNKLVLWKLQLTKIQIVIQNKVSF